MLEIYFETYGCTANYNSTEIMKGLVKQAGFNITSSIDFADLIVINSCIVKEPTEEKIRRRIQDLLKKDKKIILAGCIPIIRKEKLISISKNIFLLESSQIKNIVNLIQDIHNNNFHPEKYLQKRNEIKSNLPKISKERFIGVNQVSEGCLGECAYCIVRLTKGKLFSYPKERITQSIKNDLASGCKEIWITSQDNAAYGNENKKYLFPELLSDILKIKSRFFLRVGMMNPNNVLKILPELVEAYKDKKMYKFLHIPVQSGSDKILKKMKRKYSKEDFLKIVNEFRKKFPNMHISTDVIVGYPGETEEDFQETYDLIKKIKPETINISKFWPRPGTVASELKNIPSELKGSRASELSKLHLSICTQNQKNWINKKARVLVNQKGFGNTYLARDENYKLFAVQSKEKILGKKINVQVKKITPFYLISEVI